MESGYALSDRTASSPSGCRRVKSPTPPLCPGISPTLRGKLFGSGRSPSFPSRASWREPPPCSALNAVIRIPITPSSSPAEENRCPSSPVPPAQPPPRAPRRRPRRHSPSSRARSRVRPTRTTRHPPRPSSNTVPPCSPRTPTTRRCAWWRSSSASCRASCPR